MLNPDSLIFKTSGEKTSLLVGEAKSQFSYCFYIWSKKVQTLSS